MVKVGRRLEVDMNMADHDLTRRHLLKALGAAGASLALGCEFPDRRPIGAGAGSEVIFRDEIEARVFETPFIDTHEHFPDENQRLAGEGIPCDDWAVLFSHYIQTELLRVGMPRGKLRRFLSAGVDPMHKWRLLEPYWPAVRQTGFAQAIEATVQGLWDIPSLNRRNVKRLQSAYEATRRPGFYRQVLIDKANIQSCQVDSLTETFHTSNDPSLLMQDLSIMKMQMNLAVDKLAGTAGIQVTALDDWHDVIRWWFDHYGPYAAAIKSQGAYLRGLDYKRVDSERAAPVFSKLLQSRYTSKAQKRLLQDHLFWFCVDEATARGLPVKLHTGVLWSPNNDRRRPDVSRHPAQVAELCRASPETDFVLLHIGFPHWREMIQVAASHANAHLEMSWAWILDPGAAKDFLKSYLLSAPADRLLTFGGDYMVVENVLGHATLARRGIANALADLVEESEISQLTALDLVEPLMNGNARRIFRLEELSHRLSTAPWLTPQGSIPG